MYSNVIVKIEPIDPNDYEDQYDGLHEKQEYPSTSGVVKDIKVIYCHCKVYLIN